MPNTIYDPTLWANFGIPGLALFILFIFVVLFMFANQRSAAANQKSTAESINNLCAKIDKFADSNTEMAKALSTNFVKMTEDQNNTSRILIMILESVQDNNGKLKALHSRLDDLVNLKCKPLIRRITDSEDDE